MRRLFYILLAFFVLQSCEQETILIAEPSTVSFTDAGGTQSITITANNAWSARADQSWCQVSPSAGEDDAGTRISISCDANTSYDARSCTITISCAEMTKTISVSQATNNGLLVSQTEYNLSNSAQKLNIEVKANVAFDVIVDDACKGWIKHTATKGLSNSTVELDIAANDTYDGREGKVTIRQKDGSLQTNITIKQGQTNGLFITTSEYNLSNEKHTLTVEVLSNIEFDVKPEVSWIRHVETKGLKTSQIVLDIEANADYDAREGKVNVKQKNGDLSGTITIKQEQKYGILVSDQVLNISNEAQTIEVEVKYNVDYAVVIPEADKSWISQVNTKGLNSRHHSFQINKNETLDNRTASITFKQKDGPLSGTVTINQAQTDSIFINKSKFDLSSEKQTFEVEIKSNVDYSVSIPSPSSSWIHQIETKGVSTNKITFSVDANPTEDERQGTIDIKQQNGSITKTIEINQWPKSVLIIEGAQDTIVGSKACSINLKIKTNQKYSIEIDGADWVKLIDTKAVPEYTRLLSVEENLSSEYRTSHVTIKNENGERVKRFMLKQRPNEKVLVTYKYELSALWNEVSIFSKDKTYGFDLSSIERMYIDDIEVTPTYVYTFDTIGDHYVYVQYKNRAIPGGATLFCNFLSEAIIGDDIEYVGSNNFNGCHSLKRLHIGKSVESIERCLVGSCSPDLYITVDPDNKYYDSREDCSCVIEKTTSKVIAGSGKSFIPKSAKTIGSYSFWQTRGMDHFTIPSNVTTIEYDALMNTDMKYLTIESTSTVITEGSITRCDELISIKADKSITSQDQRCLYKNGVLLCFAPSGLTGYTIPSEISVIGGYSFYDLSNIKAIVLPNSIKRIRYLAFAGSGIEVIKVPDSVEQIGSQCFYSCNSLKKCILGKGLKEIDQMAFQYCRNLTEIYSYAKESPALTGRSIFEQVASNGTLYIPEGSDYSNWMRNDTGYLGNMGWKTSFITDNIESVTLNASNLQLTVGSSFQLSATVEPTTTGYSVIWTSSNSAIAGVSETGLITALQPGECIINAAVGDKQAQCVISVIAVDPNLPDLICKFMVEGGNKSVNILYPYDTFDLSNVIKIIVDGKEIEVQNKYKFNSAGSHIVEYYFKGNKIPATALLQCDDLTEVQVTDNAISIGESAFIWSRKLQKLTIGKHVTEIGKSICSGCYSLSTIEIDAENSTFDSRSSCNAIIRKTDDRLMQGCTNTVIPNTVKIIHEEAFSGMRPITHITIPQSVIEIGRVAFEGTEMEEITINAEIQTLGESAFPQTLRKFKGSFSGIIEQGRALKMGNQLAAIAPAGLETFTVPTGITELKSSVFTGLKDIKRIELPETLEIIGNGAFMSSGITEIVIPDKVSELYSGTFYHCEQLKKCTLGKGIQKLNNQVFEYCINLKEIRSYANPAPSLLDWGEAFTDICKNGTLYIPKGADYSNWMKNQKGYLGYYGWTVKEM